ncbi:alpha/beta hydrolase [Mycobacterium montefiorense]|uniref:Carboxylesterase n=1 Tax=Mycobacterium montefiorense TaxID=154654 RepID=A0AA37PK42_9MYCO|nr:alpha/beta fold hydrolase [Mycobacterium montefiorense]GBG40309.1 carboxylesterase [Mycobacterium montefiorense]GKU35166.1 carboxylesterase [Mycobacterium montefiorense]GKU40120.1 carboxylesterase [Mycobacterium montefiorense]GKU46059.1 carboxylesterase [Mycobacterium montefiorense]GKU52931.1 carboxylesterase [Mycobacterium montefiorense]
MIPSKPAILLLHGLTGNPRIFGELPEYLSRLGYFCSTPTLPGHGTVLADMYGSTWDDWFTKAQCAAAETLERSKSLVVIGLSMGATLALTLATPLREQIRGLVLINPLICPTPDLKQQLRQAAAMGETLLSPFGGDIKDPQVSAADYGAVPIESFLSALDAVDEVQPSLSAIEIPTLILASRNDDVLDATAAADHLCATMPDTSTVLLDKGGHLATIDYDKNEVASAISAFIHGLI